VAFTGSTATARRDPARHGREALAPGAPLIAETGGLNAMIVDSTALPEQAVRDIVASAFQSAGQRCSALRCLYVQEESPTADRDADRRHGRAGPRRPLVARPPMSARSSTPRPRPTSPPMSTRQAAPRGGCCTVSARRRRAPSSRPR
jgi:acyl-CoA reductase-like NAD-dependent aldehyde dehydrogenase